jgi:hypothetical protein
MADCFRLQLAVTQDNIQSLQLIYTFYILKVETKCVTYRSTPYLAA